MGLKNRGIITEDIGIITDPVFGLRRKAVLALDQAVVQDYSEGRSNEPSQILERDEEASLTEGHHF